MVVHTDIDSKICDLCGKFQQLHQEAPPPADGSWKQPPVFASFVSSLPLQQHLYSVLDIRDILHPDIGPIHPSSVLLHSLFLLRSSQPLGNG